MSSVAFQVTWMFVLLMMTALDGFTAYRSICHSSLLLLNERYLRRVSDVCRYRARNRDNNANASSIQWRTTYNMPPGPTRLFSVGLYSLAHAAPSVHRRQYNMVLDGRSDTLATDGVLTRRRQLIIGHDDHHIHARAAALSLNAGSVVRR